MKYKIGIFGSPTEDKVAISKAHKLGEALAKKDVILLSGACEGIVYEVVSSAHKLGTELWGYSQAADVETQKKLVHHDPSLYKKLIFIPKDYEFVDNYLVTRKYRNVTSTSHCDAGIIISGRWGTLNEFTNLFDMGKVIGVLTGTGGIADELETLSKKIFKPSKAKIFFHNDPEELIKQVLAELDKTN
ncbi:MAG TPA: hypothetical protein VND99_03300 [Candidatus Acidoferrales bacterium]|nr:hypothetical protein [Candidatus Acidoferrales bacterium]